MAHYKSIEYSVLPFDNKKNSRPALANFYIIIYNIKISNLNNMFVCLPAAITTEVYGQYYCTITIAAIFQTI